MRVGVPVETKSGERRVGLTPASVAEVVAHGHEVMVEHDAGWGVRAEDAAYVAAGAQVVPDAADIWAAADLVVKVKEPQADERSQLRRGQILFAYLHLAPDAAQTADLLASGATAVAYETVTDARGGLPLLAPMSRVAGRLAVQAGAAALEAVHGGAGLLIGGVPGVPPAKVVVIGGGTVGENATEIAIGMGGDVRVLDVNPAALDGLEQRFGAAVVTVTSTRHTLEREVVAADLIIGAVLVPGSTAPKLVTEDHISQMRAGSVVVDVAIDQGGCFATSRPTTHEAPTYIVDGVVHYCVANMPGAVPTTATRALNDATLPRVLALADGGLDALRADAHLRAGLNVHAGVLTEQHVAAALGYDWVDPADALS